MAEDNKARKLVANNKKAYHDYFIEEKYEAGIELFGTEVKSIRQGKCSIKEAWISIDKGEAFITASATFSLIFLINVSVGAPSFKNGFVRYATLVPAPAPAIAPAVA